MYNYCNTLNHNLKRGILNFSEKISKNLSRPQFKFVAQMMFGILSSQSCILSEISRKLNEKTTLKKIIDRLSRNLNTFNESEKLFEQYLHAVKSQINKNTILIVDGSDITKKYSTKSEGVATVRDGSTGEHKPGYHTVGVTVLTPEKKMPIPVYTKIFFAKENGFVSGDEETMKALKFLSCHFSQNNIRAFDRGYDNNRYYGYLIGRDEKFVIRAKKNRDVIYKGKRINIMEVAHKFKGKYSLKFRRKNGIGAITRRMIEYANKNFHKRKCLGELSSELNYSCSKLSNLFKNEVGITYTRYIQQTRIRVSCHLLLQTNMSVEQIAERVGYSNVRAYRKNFKSIMEITPLKYRLSARKTSL